MNYELQLVLIPVSDVDKAKDFYTGPVGFDLDVDHQAGADFRVVQCTPPGSACSIAFGIGINDSPPGSTKGLHLVVTDIEAAHDELIGRGVEVSDIRHMGEEGWQPGPHPERASYASFADFADPDGNVWILQEVGHEAAG